MYYLMEHHGQLLIALVLVAPFALFLPALVALVKGLPDARRILVLNAAGVVFFSAWAAALAWALVGRRNVSYYDAILRNKWRYIGVSAVVACGLLGVGGYYTGGRVYAAAFSSDQRGRYEYGRITSGPLVSEISATGRLKPLKLVQVSSQASGTVLAVMVDVNDVVARGQVIAKIDPASYLARVQQAEAQLDRAKAAQADAAASGIRAQANLAMALASADRKRMLFGRGFATRADMEGAEAGLADGNAQVGQARAARMTAAAAVAQATSELSSAHVDLERTYIRSPVSGTVMTRRVEPGQTVVSSFQTTTLFEIAENLSRMRVEAQVDEADVGRVRVGQSASFSVDSYPGRIFAGRVVAIRQSPEENQGAVSYPVRIEVDNGSRALMSGMTANVRIVDRAKMVAIRIPNAALSFDPDPDVERPAGDRVYLFEGSRRISVPVVVGLRTAKWSEAVGRRLRPGDQVIVGTKEPQQ